MDDMEMDDMSEESKDESGKKKPDEYDIKCAVEHVLKAEEIKADKKLWPLVQKELEQKGIAIKKAIRTFKDLKDVAYEKSKEA